MRPLRISNATRVLAETQDEYYALAIFDHKSEDGDNTMISIWEPTPKELEDLNNGGHVRLAVSGTIHPPVMLATQPPPEDI